MGDILQPNFCQASCWLLAKSIINDYANLFGDLSANSGNNALSRDPGVENLRQAKNKRLPDARSKQILSYLASARSTLAILHFVCSSVGTGNNSGRIKMRRQDEAIFAIISASQSSGLGTGCLFAPSPPKSPSPRHSLRLIERGGLSECECELVCVA